MPLAAGGGKVTFVGGEGSTSKRFNVTFNKKIDNMTLCVLRPLSSLDYVIVTEPCLRQLTFPLYIAPATLKY